LEKLGTTTSPAGPRRALGAEVITRRPINEDRFRRPISRVFFIRERCKECTYCWTFCPEEVLEIGDEINSNGYHYPKVKAGKEDSCVGCRMCTDICPEFAIYTVEVKQ